MFVKLVDKENVPLILNVDSISSIGTKIRPEEYSLETDEITCFYYAIRMNNGDEFLIERNHYEELCGILTKRL